MNLGVALELVKERERSMRKSGMISKKIRIYPEKDPPDPKRTVYVQGILPEEDIIALKTKTGKTSVKEAVAEAIYHYLECGTEEAGKK